MHFKVHLQISYFLYIYLLKMLFYAIRGFRSEKFMVTEITYFKNCYDYHTC